ncbi:MAG: flagellar biosynthesis protein FlhF [Pseudobdellovibrionaceae bacterium]
MQVKKFEARTVRDALEMVKKELGPEAIILSVKDNSRGFGLVGEGSVEITAAIPESALRKKQFVESKLPQLHKEKFQSSPARSQKAMIEKVVGNYLKENEPRKPITGQRYIDIDNDGIDFPQKQTGMNAVYARRASAAQQAVVRKEDDRIERQRAEILRAEAVRSNQARAESSLAQTRIKSAAQRAWAEMKNDAFASQVKMMSSREEQKTPAAPAPSTNNRELMHLRQEISQLKEVIQQFNKVPQTFVNSHPGSDFGLPFDLSATYQRLLASGIDSETAAEIMLAAQKEIPQLSWKKKALVDSWVAKFILQTTQVVDEKANSSKIHLFMGPSGHGKTSVLIKMASHMVIREGKKVAILTTDTEKVGAIEQMKIYSQILNIPFAVIRSQADWVKLAPYAQRLDAVLVDFPGLSLKNSHEIDRLRELLPPSQLDCRKHLVLSAASKEIDALEIGRRYKLSQFSDVIFSRLDESLAHGLIYSFQRKLGISLHSFGIGPRVPEDFEKATRERVLDLIFKITQLKQTNKEAEHAQ